MTKKNKTPFSAIDSGDKFPTDGDVAKTEVKAWRDGWNLDSKFRHAANPINGRPMKERLTKQWKPFLTSVTTNPHGGRVEFLQDHFTNRKFSDITFNQKSGWMSMADLVPEEEKPPVIQIENFDGKIKVEKDEPKNKKKAEMELSDDVYEFLDSIGIPSSMIGFLIQEYIKVGPEDFWEYMDSQGVSDQQKDVILDVFGKNLPIAIHAAVEPGVNHAYDAEFAYWQPWPGHESIPFYVVNKPGHPYHRSHVTALTLDKLGLSYPSPPVESKG